METPSFTPDPLAGRIKALGIAFIILPFVAGGLRFWARSLVKARYAVDDWLILPALICNLITGIALIECVIQGGLGAFPPQPTDANGEPIWTERNRKNAIWRFVIEIFTPLTIGCTKLSLLFLYRRVLVVHWFRVLVNIWIALMIGWTISFTLVFIFQCTPVSAIWSGFDSYLALYCVDQLKLFPALAISDLISDVCIVILPIPVLWKVQLPLKTKLAVIGIFLMGGAVCVAGAVRLAYFLNALADIGPINAEETATIYLTFLEAAIAIIGACLPVYRPLFVKLSGHKPDQTTTAGYGRLGRRTTQTHEHGSSTFLQSIHGGNDNAFATVVAAGRMPPMTSDSEIPLRERPSN